MESELDNSFIPPSFFSKKQFQTQIDLIKKASEVAQSKLDYESAHDDNIVRAIEIVEDFLRKKHRLCYGGQAINAHLPSKYKIYDPETTVPDYDFFTPQQNSDIISLVKDLRKAGFREISAREGMHEGTIKIYVDYIPIADMTAIDSKLYKILSKREFRMDGISYLDANSLRMLMYLELSRPRGEVSRWAKVYERLMLFNEFVPIKTCKLHKNPFHGQLTPEQTLFTINYIINQKRIFAGGDLVELYEHSLYKKHKSTSWLLQSKKPILFFSDDSEKDAKVLQQEFNIIRTLPDDLKKHKPFTIKNVSSKGVELIPSMKIICQGNDSLVFIIDQTACHSYVNVHLTTNKILQIASMDTLITLYFSLGLFNSSYFDMGSMECLANQLVDINMKARSNPKQFVFPFVSLECAGHQTTLPSLIRAKVKRLTNKKANIKKLLNINASFKKTIKQTKTKNKNKN